MARSSTVHYIPPSQISLVPNCNGTFNDIAVTIERGTEIQVYSPAIAELKPQDGDYQRWTLTGRNRRLADDTKPYTIFARLPKTGERAGYLVFCAKRQLVDGDEWLDKYRYVTPDGLADIPGEFIEDGNWYIRLGDVTLPDGNGKRAVTFDAGLLGTPQYNEEWELNPDQLPLRVELGCTVSDEDAGPTPYVYWGQSLVLTATLMEGWAAGAVDRFDHWEITRNSGDTAADELWNHPNGAGSYRTLDSNGSIALSHARGAGDVFNGAVAATFTVTAMGTEGGAPVPLASASITILAETVEQYELALSAAIVSFNPQAMQGNAYSPQGGVDVRVRATDQRGNAFNVTFGQMASAGLAVEYAPVGSDTWTPLAFSGAQGALAVATIGTAAFSSQQSLNVRLMSGSGQTRTELVRTTIAFVRDGEDSREREWIYTRRAVATTFSGSTGADALPSLITLGEVSPNGVADGDEEYDNTTDEWVPNGWTDNPQGVDEDFPYEYGAYRDYRHNSDSWGSFSEPRIYNHYGKDGEDAYAVSANPPSVSFQCNSGGLSIESSPKSVTLSMFKGASPVAFRATVKTQSNCSATLQGSTLTISTYNNNQYSNLADGGSVTVTLTATDDGVSRDLTIPVVGNRQGNQGQPGSAGPMLYPAGQWEAKTYAASGNSRPYVLYTYTDAGGNIISNYYYLSADSAAANEPPVDANGTPSDKWTLMTQADVVFAKFAIMDYGELASAVFCGDWMYSQYGTMYANGSSFTVDGSNSEQPVAIGDRTAEPFAWFDPEYPQGGEIGTFAPNWAVNLKTGEQYSSGGKVYFNSDGSGFLAGGGISWDKNGYITIRSINTSENGNVLNGLITFENMFHSTSWASGGATVLGIQPQRHFDHLDITRNSQQVTDSSVLNLGEMNARFPAISRVTALEAYFDGGVANSAKRLSGNGVCTAWGRTYWENGVPKQTVEGTLDNVADINMTGKITIGSGSSRFVIELTSDGLKFGGNIYATGSVAAYGTSGSGSGGGDAPVISTQYLDDLLDVDLPSQLSDGKVLTYRNGYWTAEEAQVQDLTNYATKTFVQQNYVAKESGKGLSSNDFTDALLARLNGIEEGANKYIHPSYSAAEITAAAGKVLSAITVNSLGHVTSVASKTLAAADIPALAASKITSGTFDVARIPNLDASKITSGTLATARIPDLSSIYLLKVAGESYPITNSLYVGSVTGRGVFVKDPAGNYVPAFYQNGENLWIGSTQTLATHHRGQTYISAGYDGQHGNTTIYVCVPNDSNNGGTNYGVWHSGNDGSGSGLDADLLDGHDSSYFATTSALTTLAGTVSAQGGRITTLEGYFEDGVAKSAKRLSGTASYTAWGQTYWENGVPKGNVKDTLYMLASGANVNSNSAKLKFNSWAADGTDVYRSPYIQAIYEANYGRKRLSVFQSNAANYTDDFVEVTTILPNGNVGIGTSAPSQKLHVVGNIMATGAVSCLGTSADGSEVTGAVYLRDLQDVLITGTPQTNYVLTFNGSNWVPQASQGGDMSQYLLKGGDTMTGNLIMNGNGIGLLPNNNYPNIFYQNGQIVILGPAVHVQTDGEFFFNGAQVATEPWANGRFVTALGTSGNYLTYTKNGSTTNLTVPFATDSKTLRNFFESRPTSANNQYGDGKLRHYMATSSMTTGKPPVDAHILHSAWDNTGGWDAQLAIGGNNTGLFYRTQNQGTWQAWKQVATADSYLPLTAGSSYPLTGQLYLDTGGTTEVYVNVKSNRATANGGGWAFPLITARNAVGTGIFTMGVNGGQSTLNYGYIGTGAYNAATNLRVYYDGSVSVGNSIKFQGSSSIYEMITFIDSGLAEGSGIAIGGGGATIIGGGESAVTMSLQVSGQNECMYIGNDQGVSIFTNLQSGWANRKEFTFDTNGNLNLLSGANGRKVAITPGGGFLMTVGTSYWGNGMQAISQTGTVLGDIGFFGNGDTLTYMYVGAAYNNTWMVVKPSGNVGIGTTSPSYKLHVAGTGYFTGDGNNHGVLLANNKAVSFTNSGGTNVRAFYLNDQNYLSLGWNTAIAGYNTGIYGSTLILGTGTSPAERMRISSAGNVGIGTTNPQHKLHVAGNVVATGAVSALGVSSQGTAVGAVTADSLTVLGVSSLNGNTTVGGSLTVSGLVNGVTMSYGNVTADELQAISDLSVGENIVMTDMDNGKNGMLYLYNGHLMFQYNNGTARTII